MSSSINYHQQFVRADSNRDGSIDEREFRSFLGPVKRDQQRQATGLTAEELRSWNSTPVVETVTYEISYDVAYYGFVEDPIKYEIYSAGSSQPTSHSYCIGPDVGIGAPNIASKVTVYDAAGAMFYFADMNHDMKLDESEFSYLMRAI